MDPLMVVLGAAVGGPARYWTDYLMQRWLGPSDGTRLAWGTLTVNLVGSLLLGVLLGGAPGPSWALPLEVGFCGSYTTFSTFAAQTDVMADRGGPARANIALNVIGCIALAAIGYAAASVA